MLNYALTHEARAVLALDEGDSAAAESWAKSSVQYWSRTDFIRWTAQARLDLARVFLALTRPEEAAAEARAALDLYQAKGDRPGAAEARGLLEKPASST